MRLRTIATVSLLGAAMVVAPAAPALANCGGVNTSQAPVTEPPKDDGGNWMLARFGLGRLPGTSDGRGVTVAVLDSGVQASHPALKGQVLSNGRDFLESGGATKGTEDCRGHGTAVASLIAGNARAGFRGIAPGASILPIRVNETVGGNNDNGRKTDDGKIAAAIDYAVAEGADVINISFAYLNGEAKPDKHKVFADAVQRALDQNVVVVAAVGNDKTATDSFPANLPGVLGVGAISRNGLLWENSTKGSFVDVTAPGGGILTAWTPGIYTEVVGTSFAAPVVAGAVALLKQAHPKWTASQIVNQIQATADPSPGGKNSKSYGAGVVDPVRAVTELPGFGAAYKNPPMPLKSEDPQIVAAKERAADRKALALWLALGGVALTVIILLSSSIVFNGSRRRWRPAE
ncbi:MAG: type VII secretion-associated serine protease mycosin [Hamadaea sp.]|uniref:type VII secretion-associated serine protease mycosin n=1 Tax=Hamadaea sp. TaxID=2024425 RepID=UPI0017AAAADF|nr:type VII secretion-associated serine protease mycosin [Hamadaea sp.]NUR74247.1 type VII secretion-associated serine protease mycosin [Hamadaea sp.]NUT19392.1 type VII secretion-associated serine protease mycosin [Hamadaea sp.]